MSEPYQWGVRDGNMKIISNQLSKHVEIYNISRDPYEAHNLANQVSLGLIRRYEERLQSWYLRMHCWFVSKLKNYDIGNRCDDISIKNLLQSNSMKHSGPKRAIIGLGNSLRNFEKLNFIERNRKEFTVYVEWIPYSKNTNVIFDFAPLEAKRDSKPLPIGIVRSLTKGKNKYIRIRKSRYCQSWQVKAGWHTSWYFMKHLRTMKAPGVWRMLLWDETNNFSTPRLSFDINVTSTYRSKNEKIGKLLHTVVSCKSSPVKVELDFYKEVIKTTWKVCARLRTLQFMINDNFGNRKFVKTINLFPTQTVLEVTAAQYLKSGANYTLSVYDKKMKKYVVDQDSI